MLLTDPPYGTTRNFWDVPLPLPELWEAVKWAVKPEPTTIEGIRTKMMKPDPETADIAKLMFEMYSQPATSFGDIARYFADEGILIYGKEMKRGFISQLLRNPIYAQADLDMYEFFKSQGTVVVNEVAVVDINGTVAVVIPYQGQKGYQLNTLIPLLLHFIWRSSMLL